VGEHHRDQQVGQVDRACQVDGDLRRAVGPRRGVGRESDPALDARVVDQQVEAQRQLDVGGLFGERCGEAASARSGSCADVIDVSSLAAQKQVDPRDEAGADPVLEPALRLCHVGSTPEPR
jgi:hypothetical protein